MRDETVSGEERILETMREEIVCGGEWRGDRKTLRL
jgi:hypothetical protein